MLREAEQEPFMKSFTPPAKASAIRPKVLKMSRDWTGDGVRARNEGLCSVALSMTAGLPII
jgi:hypothetical protein